MARWITPAVRTIADTSSLIPQTESVALPRVEGIDQDFGLRVSAGNKALYRRLLGKFAISSAGFGEQFQKARQDADATAAIRSAHSLKGSAANLGIKGVESRALQLELACKTQADAATIDRLLQDVLAELTPVLAGLQALPNNEFAQAASVQMDGLARSALWQQLRDELTDDDSQAQDTLRRYLSAIKPLPPHLARLAGLVENFEFRAALALLDSTTELTQQQSG
jgi:HPt (histidine-containing phosphotransfer) domain-containing protein